MLTLSESLSLVFLVLDVLSLNVTLFFGADSFKLGRVDLAAAEGFSQGFLFGTSSTAAADPHFGFGFS